MAVIEVMTPSGHLSNVDEIYFFKYETIETHARAFFDTYYFRYIGTVLSMYYVLVGNCNLEL